MTNDKLLLIPDGTEIEIKGVFSENYKSRGMIRVIKITEPKHIDTKYNSNVDEIVENLEEERQEVTVTGKINTILDEKEFKKLAETAGKLWNIDELYLSNSKYACISSTDEYEKCIWVGYNGTGPFALDLSVGNKITVRGEAFDLMHIKTAYGEKKVFGGFMGDVYVCYKHK